MNATKPLLGRELPGFIRDMLGSAPKVGEGVDAWLFRTARLLHTYRDKAEISALLEAATHGERIRAGAIERAVKNSEAVRWQPGERVAGSQPARAWPAVDLDARQKIVNDGPDAADLCEASPVTLDPGTEGAAGEVIESLFSTEATPDPLLCIARDNAHFGTRPLSFWYAGDRLTRGTLIVPSPMSARYGVTKEGKKSEHALSNTGARRFLVVEFDQGSADEHAALLLHLGGMAPLSLVVHSGGKSLHGWFYCQGQDEGKLRRFMEYAHSLGADHATWTRSQFVRLPDGTRENGARQAVFYFDPSTIQRTREDHEQ